MRISNFDTSRMKWDIVGQIIHSYWTSVSVNKFGNIVTENPGGSWDLPELKSYEVNWAKAANYTAENEPKMYYEFGSNLQTKGENWGKGYLRELIINTNLNKDTFRRKQSIVIHESMNNIRAKDEQFDTALTGLRITRDTSASIVMVGATVLSGGTATGFATTYIGRHAALTAADAGIQAIFEYSEKKNAVSAVVSFAGNFTFGLIPVVGKGGQKFAIVLVKAAGDASTSFATSLINSNGKKLKEGFTEALLKGAGSLTGAGFGELVKTKAFQDFLGSRVFPVSARINYLGKTGQTNLNRAVSFTEETTAKLGTIAVNQTFGGGAGAISSLSSPDRLVTGANTVIPNIALINRAFGV